MATLLDRLRNYDRERLPPLRQPALNTTGAAPMQFGGRGYGNTARESLGMPELDTASRYIRNDGVGYERLPSQDGQVNSRLYGSTPDQIATAEAMANISSAMSDRAKLRPNVQQIATIQPDSPLPTINGADYTRLKQTEGAILASARPQLDPANVRQAFSSYVGTDGVKRPGLDPLAEKKAAEAAMGGRTIEDVVSSMERRTPRGTLESAARLNDRDLRMADANRNADADRRAALAVETRKGLTALDVETRKGKNEANSIRAGLDAQRQDDLIRRELKIERPALPGRDQVTDAYLDGVRRGSSAALRQPDAAASTPGNYPENAAAAAPAQAAAPAPAAGPTPAHIERLKQMRANPQAIADFERRYGAGSAAQYLK